MAYSPFLHIWHKRGFLTDRLQDSIENEYKKIYNEKNTRILNNIHVTLAIV